MSASHSPALETLLLCFSPEIEQPLPLPESALFIGAEFHQKLLDWPTSYTTWQPLKPIADVLDSNQIPRVDIIPNQQWPCVMVLPGKSRNEILAHIALAKKHLLPNGILIVSLPNTAGAGRYEKEIKRATHQLISIQKNKCRAFYARKSAEWNESIFNEWEKLLEHQPIAESTYITCAGAFSADHIDPGSALLVKHLPSQLHGHVADLGAAWGYLSDELLLRFQKITQLDLYEADSRSLDCAKINLLSHHRADRPVHFFWHDVTTGLNQSYDAIVMNPPFHSGQSNDPDLGCAFIIQAGKSLKRGGRLFIVANRQLPYETILQKEGLIWNKSFEDQTYKILTARKP